MLAFRHVSKLLLAFLALGCTEQSEVDGLVYANPSGSFYGSITSSPPGIDVQPGGGRLAAAFEEGARVTLTATTDGRSTFVGWTGEGCSGTGPCEVTSKGPGFYQYVLATFRSATVPPSFMLTLEAPPREAERLPGVGTVTVSGAGIGTITCTRAGEEQLKCNGQSATFSFGAPVRVTLTASPGAGSTFGGWLAAGCGASPVCELDVSDTHVRAYVFFEES